MICQLSAIKNPPLEHCEKLSTASYAVAITQPQQAVFAPNLQALQILRIDSFQLKHYINNQSVIKNMRATKSIRPTTPDTPARHERRKDARPAELLAAALDLFVEKGFSATRVEEVAHRAGVSKGTLFLYFASKEELFKAVVRENISGRFSQWNAEFDAYEGSTADLLAHFLILWWKRLGSTKASGITKLMLSEAKNFPELATFYQHEVIRPANVLIQRVLQRGVDRGEFAPIDMKYSVFSVLSPMIFLQLLMHSKVACWDDADTFQLEPEEFLTALAKTLLDGLRLRPPASSPRKKGTDSL
jgi:TetR/AcrR family transcriptional regulator